MASYYYDPNTTPVLAPPEGVIPNFADPVSIAYISRNVACVFLALLVAFLALRLYSRTMITRSFGIDDVLHLLAGASIVVFCGILLSLLDHPNGRHLWDVPLSIITDPYLKVNFVFVIMGAVGSMLVKVSLLALYLRLFGSVRNVRISIYLCMGIIVLFYLATMIAELVIGVPRNGIGWQMAQNNYGPFGLHVSSVRGVFGVVSDFAIIAIPLTQTFKIQIATRKKIVLVCVFLTGLLACVSSIISCVYRFREQNNLDYTWANIMPNTFSTIELTVGHICGSLPTLPALINHLGKNEAFLSMFYYLRSSLYKKGDSEDLTPQYSPDNAEKLHRDSRGRLTSLKTFIQKARLATLPSRLMRTNRTERNSNNDDIESIDVDYHTQLKNVATRDQIRRTELDNGGAELPESIRV